MGGFQMRWCGVRPEQGPTEDKLEGRRAVGSRSQREFSVAEAWAREQKWGGRRTASPQLAEECGRLSRSSSSHTGASRGKLPPNTVAKTDRGMQRMGARGLGCCPLRLAPSWCRGRFSPSLLIRAAPRPETNGTNNMVYAKLLPSFGETGIWAHAKHNVHAWPGLHKGGAPSLSRASLGDHSPHVLPSALREGPRGFPAPLDSMLLCSPGAVTQHSHESLYAPSPGHSF